jgi:fermentation-respiration switch protein FrsA (DUF1100 family)
MMMRKIMMVTLGIVVACAGLLALIWTQQRKLIYFPFQPVPQVAAVLPGATEVTFETADGLLLAGWFLPAQGGPTRATVLFTNGNAGNRAGRAPLAAGLADAGFSVLLFDYRGYGGNPGSPSEQGLIADARAARAYLASREDVDPGRIVYFGESLGTGVAVALAAEQPPLALALRSPFTSLSDVARLHYPFLPVGLMLRDTFNSQQRIKAVRCPLLILAGSRDGVVPEALSRTLFDAALQDRKRLVIIDGAGHNDAELSHGARVISEVAALVNNTEER